MSPQNTPTLEQAQRLVRPTAPALDALLGVAFPVLDDGFIRVVDYMGTDESVVQAARVSYGVGTKAVSDDRQLIRYLLRHRHSTPFEMAELKLHVRVPMDAWRQWIRHRTASVNEYSTRYSEAIAGAQTTHKSEWRTQATDNKQGSGEYLADGALVGEYLTSRERELHEHARAVYEERLRQGVAREQARKDLPLSTYTEAYWKCDLHNLLHFLDLRMDPHAQLEIRTYANVIAGLVQAWVPLTYEAFLDYRRNALTLSYLDQELLQHLSIGDRAGATAVAEALGWLDRRDDGTLKNVRERREFEQKCARIGITPPWLEG